ncbi:MAG: Asp-tRNA(Asn)/Glu-tRNA(Gln) amidotransferase subunit GatC [Rickettsiales bacterium]|jgi:aspartyl-tRNA(Asn)/glutamyl-tRNA(Gln) amidotransferase subunit C|nr:Asp-tRNA(Asn)/Glu-tRNA(Gln) amidotransferase subunit GatC [Rickettsiales bacterium]
MDKEKLQRLEKLAMIEIKEKDRENIMNLVNSDIVQVKTLYEVDTNGLEPMTNPYDIRLEVYEDIVSDGGRREELLKCSPQTMSNCFVVPKMIES